jgi:predicted Zn-dependent peptidase
MRAEEISEHADNNASEFLHYGKIRAKESLIKEIETTTKKQIITYAQKLFVSKPTVSALGPINNMMPYDEIVSRLKE